MSECASLVVTATPNPDEMPSVQTYLMAVMPLLLQAGGNLVKKQRVTNIIHGRPAGMVLVMDFESADAIESIFNSDAYGDLIPVRDKGFIEMNILISSDM
jgi:uncharacterized protein (DUF1330 family)